MSVFKGFTEVELTKPKRSTFDLSHEKRVSSMFGKLTPILCAEAIPGDSWYGSSEILVKLAPMIAPIFQRVNIWVHYFFVPNRLIWEDWEDFITGGRLGYNVTTPPVPPYFNLVAALQDGQDYLDVSSLADYLGVPPIADADSGSWTGDETLDLMPFGAYYQIWYDYYRDRNFYSDSSVIPLISGAGSAGLRSNLLPLRYRSWQHDYFTSALPWTQRGNEVLLPLEGTGDVTYLASSQAYTNVGGNPTANANIQFKSGTPYVTKDAGTGTEVRIENIDEVQITSSSIGINDVRVAFKIQQWLERNALGGSRYIESNLVHFHVRSSDQRLQRAQYIGGGRAAIQVGEVMTTAYSEDSVMNVVPPAERTGTGQTYSEVNSFKYYCEEHGFVVGIMSVMPTTSYDQGLPRMFQNRNTFLEYPWPLFAHLGEQEVYDSEIYLDDTSLPADRTTQPVFGYQSRYSDWKFISNSNAGEFRTGQSLEHWHLTRKFAAQPTLTVGFTDYDAGLEDRIFNVSGVDVVWTYIYNSIKVKRALPYFGTPKL